MINIIEYGIQNETYTMPVFCFLMFAGNVLKNHCEDTVYCAYVTISVSFPHLSDAVYGAGVHICVTFFFFVLQFFCCLFWLYLPFHCVWSGGKRSTVFLIFARTTKKQITLLSLLEKCWPSLHLERSCAKKWTKKKCTHFSNSLHKHSNKQETDSPAQTHTQCNLCLTHTFVYTYVIRRQSLQRKRK